MRHCVDCGTPPPPDDARRPGPGSRAGRPHGAQEGPSRPGDGKQMSLLAVLEGRPDAGESWGGCLRLGRGRRCSLAFGVVIMTVVMASYVLSGARQELLLASPFRYGAFPAGPSPPAGGGPGHGKEQLPPPPPPGNLSSARDAPDMRLVIDSIVARIAFTARQLPSAADLRRQEPHMFAVIPRQFLPGSRSPCWYEEFAGRNTSDPYGANAYALRSRRFRATFAALRKAFWGHLALAGGRRFRLRCLPRFYIVGQPKCGTTDLYDRLRLHPEVRFAAVKEPHWWTRKRFGIVRLRDGLRDRYPVEDYLDLFDLAAHQVHQGLQAGATGEGRRSRIVIGEASASTMWDNNAWTFFYDNSTDGEPPFLTQDFLHAVQPDARLILMLRDPVERLYSDYLYFASSNKSAQDFHEKVTEALQLFETCLLDASLRACVYNNSLNNAMPVRLQVGLYAVYLLDWLAVFHREQLLVLRLEDHATDVRSTMRRVCQFLSLGPLSEKQEALMTRSPASNARRPEDRSLGPMWPLTQRLLRGFYGPFNARLAQVLGDEAFAWRKT